MFNRKQKEIDRLRERLYDKDDEIIDVCKANSRLTSLNNAYHKMIMDKLGEEYLLVCLSNAMTENSEKRR